ncbi:MAG: MarR family winged helix-turn-helix transcriptional regulator [Anaerolineaceae bacterium]|nr:MarR family winged helix-turn-helix transcriptional regulator [Anaerolineaceae bacterium]
MNSSSESQFLELLLHIKRIGSNLSSLEEVNLTPALFTYLNTIQQFPISTLNEVSQHIGVTPASASNAIKRLEKDNLVKREHNPHDHRSSVFTLSNHGEEVYQFVQSFRRKKAKVLLDRLSEEDQRIFLSLFSKLLDIK